MWLRSQVAVAVAFPHLGTPICWGYGLKKQKKEKKKEKRKEKEKKKVIITMMTLLIMVTVMTLKIIKGVPAVV